MDTRSRAREPAAAAAHDGSPRPVLAALCDALVPSVDGGFGDAGERDFMRRSAGDMGLAAIVAAGVAELPTDQRDGVLAMLDALEEQGFTQAPAAQRVALLHRLAGELPHGRLAVKQLKAMVMGLFYALPDELARNPNWDAIGFPGPISEPPSPAQAPKTIALESVTGARAELTADVCVVGSGAGGAVIAAELAGRGQSVLVLELGPYRNEADFRQLELPGTQELYLRGGTIWSDDGSLGLIAGSTLGGGTTINSMVCLRPPARIRRKWADAGLEGVDGPDFDRDLDAVWTRLGVNTEATVFNANTQLMVRGLDRLGRAHEPIPRNAALDDDPRYCGYCNAGCQQGCKRSVLATYLQDASDAGARCVVGCRAERVLVRDGRAEGVVGRVTQADGTSTELVVRAPTVVVAAGGLESPALLLRSGIGGPAVGHYLRVHPAYMVSGVYDDRVDAWSGQIQSAVSFDFTEVEDGTGFLVETLTLSPAMWAGAIAWPDGEAHKREMLKLPFTAAWHGVSQDHGSGRVTLDSAGEATVRWRLDDPIDLQIARRAHVELARLHRAAGAREVFTFHWTERRWRDGEDFDEYLRAMAATEPHDITAFSAHQMGTCRLGSDPGTSVADGRGELHDVRGVWIGDGSALPTTPAVNPMISIMAIARRTAGHMVAAIAADGRPPREGTEER